MFGIRSVTPFVDGVFCRGRGSAVVERAKLAYELSSAREKGGVI